MSTQSIPNSVIKFAQFAGITTPVHAVRQTSVTAPRQVARTTAAPAPSAEDRQGFRAGVAQERARWAKVLHSTAFAGQPVVAAHLLAQRSPPGGDHYDAPPDINRRVSRPTRTGCIDRGPLECRFPAHGGNRRHCGRAAAFAGDRQAVGRRDQTIGGGPAMSTDDTVTQHELLIRTEWTTDARPPAPETGTTGFNVTLGATETWNGSDWIPGDCGATGGICGDAMPFDMVVGARNYRGAAVPSKVPFTLN